VPAVAVVGVVVLPVVVDDVGAVDPSRRCITGGASLSEFTVVSAEVSMEVLVELVVLWVVEVDAGREGSGHVELCDALGDDAAGFE
jgi:hypothetical protein